MDWNGVPCCQLSEYTTHTYSDTTGKCIHCDRRDPDAVRLRPVASKQAIRDKIERGDHDGDFYSGWGGNGSPWG